MMTQYNDITRFFMILASILLLGCQSTSVERQRNGDDRFKTTAPSMIYFKNIKSIKYQNNRNPQTQMDFYRPKAFLKPANTPVIYPVIIHNWLEDESYLTFEMKNVEEGAKILVEATIGDTTELNWPNKDYLNHLDFVRKLENALKSGQDIFIEQPREGRRVLKYNLAERTSFSAALQDFLNLTETASSRAKK